MREDFEEQRSALEHGSIEASENVKVCHVSGFSLDFSTLQGASHHMHS
jgi:hypothetical protein